MNKLLLRKLNHVHMFWASNQETHVAVFTNQEIIEINHKFKDLKFSHSIIYTDFKKKLNSLFIELKIFNSRKKPYRNN